jgi:hypothetical protein
LWLIEILSLYLPAESEENQEISVRIGGVQAQVEHFKNMGEERYRYANPVGKTAAIIIMSAITSNT